MKRFHVHVAVNDLEQGIAFYSQLFAAEPTVRKADYAKWMVDDPRINFAISARGAQPGVNHLGFQLDSDEEFRAMRDRLARADAGLVEDMGANCCYAKSDKVWVTDPAGVAWETYHTLGSIPVFGAPATQDAPAATACCAPAPATVAAKIPVKSPTRCCP
jgi:catechol 2,3-dioxygenase-like lactoylglutathione lyase family enzyme